MTVLLVDNSVWQRVPRSSAVRAELHRRTVAGDRFAHCSASLDEASYSARSLDDLYALRERLRAGTADLATNPEVEAVVIQVREALFAAGWARAAGVVDVQLAAVAVHHRATVLHYDEDFEHIAGANGLLCQEWVVPRGSIA